jgi:hypothetical protein
MADYIVINKYLHYQQGITIYPLMVGETRTLEFIKSIFASHIIDAYLKDGTFELFTQKQEEPVIQNTDIDLKPIEATQIEIASQDTSTVDTSAQDNDNAQNQTQNIDTQPVQDADATINTVQPQDGNEADTQDNTQPQVFEIMYKITQPIQDKDGNEIEVGSQFIESELKELIVVDQRKSNKKIKELLQDEKLIELKIVK